ncbi:MAG: class I SAM-dependent methyltransferase [Candidatus Fermentibacteria bacterium]|nr:class I SAM-dependent methyltransferase [Candidatus Fermentibacteria bacterium]
MTKALKDSESTIQHYESKAEYLATRYESANVRLLQTKLLQTLKYCNSILELGCGSGRDAAFILKTLTPESITITDGSDNMLTLAARIHPELTPFLKRLELPEDLRHEERTYDGIFSIATLMHLTNQGIMEFLQETAGLLRTPGVLFVSVCTKREEQTEKDPRTFTLRNKQWWINQFKKAGLNVTEAAEAADGLNRNETIWLNITAEKQP